MFHSNSETDPICLCSPNVVIFVLDVLVFVPSEQLDSRVQRKLQTAPIGWSACLHRMGIMLDHRSPFNGHTPVHPPQML